MCSSSTRNNKNFTMFLATQTTFVLTFVTCVLLRGTEAYSTGADPSACTTMEPRHGATAPSDQLSPYVVLVSQSTYTPGDSVSVMLRGLCGTQFMGFLVQSRRADPADDRYRTNPSQAIGTFQAVAGTQYQCGTERVALTHDGRYDGTTVLFNWTAPDIPQGHVQIKATFVQNFTSMWTSVASVVIQDPQASPISVDADTLRTDFIEPCEIDRPKSPTTATTTPSPIPITAPMTVATSSVPPSTTTIRPENVTTPEKNGAVSTSVTPVTTSVIVNVTSETALATVEKNLTITTQTSVLTPDVGIKCGETHGCFRQCTSSQICEFRVAWQPRNESVWFDVMVPPLDDLQDQWLALAFSDDPKMGQDSVVECLSDRGGVTSHLSFNGHRDNSVISSEESGEVIEGVIMSREDGYLHCQFVRKLNTSDAERVYDLDNDWFLLLAQGSVKEGRKERHAGIPVASARLVDLQALEDVGVWVQDKIFIKLHASLMTFAWIFCAGFGIVMARYTKPLWPKHKLCGRKVWFTIHRGCMVLLGVLTLIGFIVIFVEAKGFSAISVKEIQKMHPVLGIIVTLFTVIQIVFGIIRPSSSSKNRPAFNWGHWLLGFFCYILSLLNMGLGLKLRKAGTHASSLYVLYAYAIYQITMIIVLEIICCNIRIKENKTASYVIYERRNTIYSSTKEIMQGNDNEPPGSIALRIAIRVHLLFVTAFAAALTALIAIAH